MPFDPNIVLQATSVKPFDPIENAMRLSQLRWSDIQNRLGQARLAQLQRQQDAEVNTQNAARTAVIPQQGSYQEPAVNLGGMMLPGRQVEVQGPPQFNRQAFLSNPNLDPLVAEDYRSRFAAQDAESQKQQAAIAEALSKASSAHLADIAKHEEFIGQNLAPLLQMPEEQRAQSYPHIAGVLIDNRIADERLLPRQYPGAEGLQMIVQRSMSVKDQATARLDELQFEETKRHNRATEVRKPVPGVDVPYPPSVEAQRARINASRAAQNGLSPQQLARVTGLASQFDSNPVVKTFNEQVGKYQGVKQIVEQGLGGVGDLAVVYEFMKGLDPTSVVRESEYATASKSGNIFAGALARFNGYFKPEGGMLPQQVKDAFLKVVETKMRITQEQAKRMHNDFARRIDKITGGSDGSEYLTDYAGLYDGSSGAKSKSAMTITLPSGKQITID